MSLQLCGGRPKWKPLAKRLAAEDMPRAMSRARIAPYVLALLVVLLLAPFASSSSFSAVASNQNLMPDVLVWIDAREQGRHWVSLTYAKVIEKSQVEDYFNRLLSETGWTATNVDISDQSLSASGENPMTSIVFVAPQAVRLDSGTLPIEPIVKALRDLKGMKIVYIVPPDFRFRGLSDFENKYVKISLKRGTNTYEYTVTIKDADFDTLGLPTTGVRRTPSETKRDRPGAVALLLVAMLAVLAAALTYLVMSRAAKTKAGNRNRRS